MRLTTAIVAASIAAAAPSPEAGAAVVFQNSFDNGFFTPFNAGNAGVVKYGDGGWLSGFTSDTYTLTKITMGLATFGGTFNGGATLHFTLNDGDPSGLVFGPGTQLYATSLPISLGAGTNFFDVEVPLPNVVTSGGFNNIGWSISVSDYQYDGQFGVQCSSAFGQFTGFYTNNASFYNGSSWSLFSFGGDPITGVANYVATIEGFITPAPGAVVFAGIAAAGALRRRR